MNELVIPTQYLVLYVSGHSSMMETKQSEGTVLFHVLHSANLGFESTRLMLRTLRSLCQAPELIFGGPLFLPSALLIISSNGAYRDTVSQHITRSRDNWALHGLC